MKSIKFVVLMLVCIFFGSISFGREYYPGPLALYRIEGTLVNFDNFQIYYPQSWKLVNVSASAGPNYPETYATFETTNGTTTVRYSLGYRPQNIIWKPTKDALFQKLWNGASEVRGKY